MDKKIIDELKKTVIKKYSTKEEIAHQIKIIDRALFDYEKCLIDKYFTFSKEEFILDIGCGAGRETIALSKMGFNNTIGIDFNPILVNIAKNKSRTLKNKSEFLVMDACKLGFKENKFAACLLLAQTLATIPGKKNRLDTLSEINRVLKKNGILILSTHSRNSHIKYKIYFLVMDNLRRLLKYLGINTLEAGDRFATNVSGEGASPGKAFIHMYSLKEAINDIESSGFSVVECKSRYELIHNIDNYKIREKDYIILYVAKKE